MRSALSIPAAIFFLVSPAWAQTETVIQRPSGERVTVRTDESGTTVIQTKSGAAAKLPEGPGEEAHRDKVYEFTREGGKIELERKEQK